MQIDGSSCWITENKTCVGTTETLRARDTRMCGKYQRRKKLINKVEIRAHDPSTTCMRQIKASLLPHQSRQSMAMDFDTLKSSKYVCVVGAGASGLVSARELLREGHSVVVLEQNHDLGGQWLYQDVGAATNTIHSSVYASLRLNAPRASMEFTDFMFTPVVGRDTRDFPGHRELFLYLKDFARCFGLTELIRFNTEVVHVGVAAATGKWIVRSRNKRTEDGEFMEEIFDAVVIATGHFSLPRLPKIKGMEEWKRKQLHSHVYRVPEPFQDEVVVVVGGSISGPEIAMELVHVAKEVHISTKHVEIPPQLVKPVAKYAHLLWHQEIELLCEDGTVIFADGSSVVADTILYCTGYSYSFPFLDTKGVINVDEKRIGPLYEHTFPPSLSPSLSFVGIPYKFVIARFLESQARWIAQVLSGKRKLPSAAEMMMKAIEEVERHQELEEPKNIIQAVAEIFEYYDRYGDQCDFPHLEDWRKEILLHHLEKGINNIETFRDE